MKKLIYCLLLLAYQTVLAQNKTAQSNDIKQTQITSVVTICDQFSGKLSKADILAKPYLTIQNNTLKWQISSFIWQFMVNAKTCIYHINGDKLTTEAISRFNDVGSGGYIFIYGIQAVNKYGATGYLPSIAIQIKQ